MFVKILSLQYEKQRRNETMGKLLLTGVDGNLGETAAEILLTLEPKENLIFCGYSEEALKKYADMEKKPRLVRQTLTTQMDCRGIQRSRCAGSYFDWGCL